MINIKIKLPRIIFLIILIMFFIQSCDTVPKGATDSYSIADLNITPLTKNGYSGCDNFMMDYNNIDNIEVDVYTLSSGDSPTPVAWKTAPHQIIRPDQFGNYKLKVPIDGSYVLTLRVVGKCSNCCVDCYPSEGKPIYKGNSKFISGSIIPDIEVSFVNCECCF